MSHVRFVKFLLAGGIAAAVNFGSRILLGHWLDYAASIILAYCIGMATAFVLNRMFVFEASTNRLQSQVLWFIAVNLAAVAQTLAVSLLFARVVFPAIGLHWQAETIAHGIGVLVPAITSYFGHLHLSFRRRVQPAD